MFWVNIDKPTKTCVIHKEGCRYILSEETPYKGIERLKCDGGWFSFVSLEEAENYAKEEWEAKGYKVWQCKRCFT